MRFGFEVGCNRTIYLYEKVKLIINTLVGVNSPHYAHKCY